MDEAKEEVAEMKDSEKKVEERLGTINDPSGDQEHGNLAEEEEMDEEMDLDEILAELDEEMGKDDDMNEAEEAEEEEVDVDMEMEDDEDIDLEEMSEDDLKSFIEDVIRDMVGAGELEAGEEFEGEDDMEDMEVEDEEEIEVEDEVAEIMEGDEELEEGALDKLKSLYTDKELLSKIITVDGEKVSIKDLMQLAASGATSGMKKSGAGHDIGPKEGMEEMDEMKKELDELRSELYEVNLLNAKLLYTNKIFRAKNLQEAQKVKVLEAFDKASSVKEVKLVYETLNEGIQASAKTVVKESLGSASKAAGMAPTKPIMDIDPQVARWQKLAGIK